MFARLVIVQAVFLLFQSFLYFGCERFQKRTHDVERRIDKHIPFIPLSVIIYCLWFPLIFLFPIAIYYIDSYYYYLYMSCMGLNIIISVFCYMIYPTTFQRPDPPDNCEGMMMRTIYKGSYRGLNCAPSLHCSSCYLVIAISLLCMNIPLILKVGCIILAMEIVLSTLTTKQHTLLDVVTALPVMTVSVVCGFYWGVDIAEKMLCVVLGV